MPCTPGDFTDGAPGIRPLLPWSPTAPHLVRTAWNAEELRLAALMLAACFAMRRPTSVYRAMISSESTSSADASFVEPAA